MASAIARAYNGGLGAKPPAGFKGRAPGQESGGRSPHEAEAVLVFGRSMEAANLPIFLKFRNPKKSNICVIRTCQKIMDGHKIGGTRTKLGRGPVPRPGFKTATGHSISVMDRWTDV